MPAKRRVSEPGAERVTLARLPWLPGVEVLRAENSQRCWRVYHEGYSFCTPDPGWDALASWRYRGREHAMAAHTQQLFEPGEAHHTFKVGGPPVAFDVLLLEPSLVANWLGRQPPHLQPRSDDPHLQVLLRRACAAIRNAADPLRVELALSRCVGALFAEASEGPGPCAEPRLGDWRVKRVREMIHDGAGDALRLEPLASEVGLSAARLVTLFRQCTSLPVHQYITALRLTKVMRQMARGVSPSDAAIASGFYDLSHLGRLMRRHIGTTPSAYFAAVHR